MQKKKVIVGMSGGVDSSVAAWLLLAQGYQVEGLFMKNWEEDDAADHCAAAADLADAKAVCQLLQIPLHTANFAAEYWDRVFEHFLHEYRAGRTPNPDILCNKEIKFKAFLQHALTLGADCIATGHYAGRQLGATGFGLTKAADLNKDQTYFLYTLSQRQLEKTLFPLAGFTKPEVRAMAKQLKLPNHTKKDSTGICFIGERKFKTFLAHYLPANPGAIVDELGHTVGQHDGLMYYTLGQRQGLRIGGRKDAANAPWYVIDKNLEKNLLIVAQGSEHPKLYHAGCIAEQCHWVAGKAPSTRFSCRAKVRYRQSDQACRVTALPQQHQVEVTFETPQRAITPGQSVVFYANHQCLGGGVIHSLFDRGDYAPPT